MSDLATLGDHVAIITGNPFKSSCYTGDSNGIRLLRGDNVAQGKIRWDSAKYWPVEDAGSYDLYQLKEGDVIAAMDRPWIEAGLKYAELRSGDVPSLLVQRVACLRALPSLDQRYLAYLIGSPGFTSYVLGVQTGTAVPHISGKQILDFKFLLPSLHEQKAIGEVLGALDDKIAVNDRIARKSREMITLKYEESVASGVKSARIGEIAELFDGPHATPEKTESGPWFLSISSLSGGRLLLGESAHLSEDDFARWTRRVTPKPGDVLFSYETRLGDAALMPAGIRACLGRRMALLRPRDVGSRTLLQAFLAPSFQETIRKYAIHGATVERISLTDFPSWLIELPAQEQNQSESIFAKFDDLAQESERENETLTALRDALLPKLMSGQIRVRDAVKVVEDVT